MPNTEARRKAARKYQTEKVTRLYIHVPVEMKPDIEEYAKKKGVSVNSLVVSLLKKELDNDK